MNHHYLFRMLTAIVAFVLTISAFTPASAHVAQPVTLTGVLVGQSGRALPNMELSLFGYPPGSEAILDAATSTVVTDAQGNFTWIVPTPPSGPLTTESPVIDAYALISESKAPFWPTQTGPANSPQFDSALPTATRPVRSIRAASRILPRVTIDA